MNEKEIQSFYIYLQSQQTAQQFLMKCYEKNEVTNAECKSYKNCNTFIFYLKHGLHFYETGKKLHTMLQPILFFYGMIHMIKATLLTVRPNYPETTKLLAHGVSARKRKKKQYTFMNDEVKIQHQGLFPYFSKHLFNIEKFNFEKLKMKDLFAIIPEMNSLFTFKKDQKIIPVGKLGKNSFVFPITILDDYFLTKNAFIRRIFPSEHNIQKIFSNKKSIHIQFSSPITQVEEPFYFNNENQKIYFPIDRENFLSIPETMVHYLLLYNLSMISRYETEWWGDLLTTMTDIDYPFIVRFLQITPKKVPLTLGHKLYQMFI